MELIQSVLKGQEHAYGVLVQRYQQMVFTVAFRITRNREDAEELAQSAFIKAYKCLADFRGQSRFSTWLYTIVHSLCLSFLRKKKADILSLDNEKVRWTAEGVSQGNTWLAVEGKSRSAMLKTAMEKLQPHDAQVLALFYQGEQSLEEIGLIMGIDPNTAKVKLHRARTRLKKVLETMYPQEEMLYG